MNQSNDAKKFVLKLAIVIAVSVALFSIYQLIQIANVEREVGELLVINGEQHFLDEGKFSAIVRIVISGIVIFFCYASLKKSSELETSDLIKCPDCAELVKAEAIKCKHCGARLEKQEVAGSYIKSEDTAKKTTLKWVPVVVIAAALGVLVPFVNSKITSVNSTSDVKVKPTTFVDAAALPSMRNGESYAEIRQRLETSGWAPYHAEEAEACATGDERCAGRPEMLSCAGTGAANCKFLWKKGNKIAAICTVGEINPKFDTICGY